MQFPDTKTPRAAVSGRRARPLHSADLAYLCNDPERAREYLETVCWPEQIVCPHCSSLRTARLWGAAHTYKCYGCRGQFNVRTGTVLAHSHVPLDKWLRAVRVACSGSANAPLLAEVLDISEKTARALLRRILEAIGHPRQCRIKGCPCVGGTPAPSPSVRFTRPSVRCRTYGFGHLSRRGAAMPKRRAKYSSVHA